jgi:hypothetical protein
MRRAALLLSVAFGTLLLAPSAASGGGWWSSPHFSSRYLVSGETAVAETEDIFASVEAAKHPGDFYVYLIPDLNWRMVDRAMGTYPPGDWWRTPNRAFRVGRVDFVSRDSNLVKAEARFEVPDLPPGGYAVMFCDLGCSKPMANAIPVEMTLVDSPQALTLSKRLDHVKRQFAARLARIRRQLRASVFEARAASATENEVDILRDRVTELEDGLAEVSAREPVVRTDWRPVIAVAVVGMGTALLLARSGRPRGSVRNGRQTTTWNQTSIPDDPAELEQATERVPSTTSTR